MTDQVATLGDILRDGLTAAQTEGVSQVRAQHLSAEQLDLLAALTLAHLRAQPGKASSHEGWLAVSPRSAGVMPWWAETANLTETERPRLRTLRRDVYDVLELRGLIEKGPGQGAFVHVSPAGLGEPVGEPSVPDADVADISDEGAFGAWVLKLSPYVYDANRVFAAPDRRVYRWSVDDNDRSADMPHGQPAFLWMDAGDHSAGQGSGESVG